MDRYQMLQYVLSNKATRVAYFEHDFWRFARYHFDYIFKTKSPPFHEKWAYALESDDNVILKGFRESGKTVWLTVFYIWCIAYKKRRFIMHYCFEIDKSESRLFDLITQLQTSESFIEDYGELYPSMLGAKDAKKKAGVKEFITTNGVMVKAMSIGISPRGANFITTDGSYRPDLIGLDDIDVHKSVQNGRIIEKTYDFIMGEVLGGISSGGKLILLGNVIRKDGVVPRMENQYRSEEGWQLFKQAVYNEDGSIAWPERYVETDEEAEITGKISLEQKKRDQGSRAYAQNFLLVPATDEGGIIRREHIRYGYIECDRIVIGVDPAFSKKSLSDAFAISVVGHAADGRKNVRAVYALHGAEKDTAKALDFIEKLYRESGANIVHFEAVAAQMAIAQMLRERGIATRDVRPHADKVTRLSEYQPAFESGKVLFDPDGPGIKEAVEEIIDFPNGVHDDRVDAVMYGMMDYKSFDVTFG